MIKSSSEQVSEQPESCIIGTHTHTHTQDATTGPKIDSADRLLPLLSKILRAWISEKIFVQIMVELASRIRLIVVLLEAPIQ